WTGLVIMTRGWTSPTMLWTNHGMAMESQVCIRITAGLTEKAMAVGGLRSEDDGKVEFRIHTDAELSPSEQEDLAETYSPVMYFHEDEEFYPREIGEFLDDSDLKNDIWYGGRKITNIIKSSPSKSDLGEYTDEDYYLDWDGDEPDHDDEYAIYSHVFTATDNKIVIQYWFFYLNNPGTEHLTEHEGDWEMIQIICDENGNPHQ
ncbi:MAG: hypothetical protein ACOC53_08050, partial [Candidatus Saliniplasma sp.]